jgi:Holliday junction resolvasome RuvABC endonuclease subunit
MERKRNNQQDRFPKLTHALQDIDKKYERKYVLTNDPSITAWGWAVVDPVGNKVIASGAIKTAPSAKKLKARKGDDRVRRVQEINVALLEVIKKYNICLIVSELPHGSQSAVAAIMIGMVTGVMQTIGDCLNIPVEWFSEIPVEWFRESDAKLAVTGKRSVENMIPHIHDLFIVTWTDTKWRDEAIADALAVYYVAWQQSTSLKMIAVSN